MNETQLAILREFAKAWARHPEQRFGQLIENIAGKHTDPWSPDNEDWLQAIKRWNETHP